MTNVIVQKSIQVAVSLVKNSFKRTPVLMSRTLIRGLSDVLPGCWKVGAMRYTNGPRKHCRTQTLVIPCPQLTELTDCNSDDQKNHRLIRLT